MPRESSAPKEKWLEILKRERKLKKKKKEEKISGEQILEILKFKG